MADDWLKIRENLHEQPEVLQMASELKTRPEHIVGYCLKFWGWVSRSTRDGKIHNVTLDDVESVLNLPHFLNMMRKVGWLEYVESTKGTQIIVPKFERHMSQSAKSRALAARNKAKNRVPKVSRRCPDPIATKTGPEKRREEKSKETPLPPFDKGGDVSAVVEHYRQKHPRSRPGVKERKLVTERLKEGYSPQDLTAAIDGCHKTPHNLGENDRGQKYLALSLIMRDSSQVARFIEAAETPNGRSPPNPRQQAERIVSGLFVRGRKANAPPEKIAEVVNAALRDEGLDEFCDGFDETGDMK